MKLLFLNILDIASIIIIITLTLMNILLQLLLLLPIKQNNKFVIKI